MSAVVLLVGMIGCDHDDLPDVESFRGPTMGTVYSVRFFRSPKQGPRPPLHQSYVRDRLAEINRQMSTYDPESEVSRFNASESTDWFPVSDESASVVAFALQLAEDSAGAFDPTIGPLVNLWGFGPGARRSAPPTDDEIAEASAATGWRNVEVRIEPPAMKKSKPGVRIDLSAVAKGFGSDAVGELLAGRGASGFMVEIGGEVATRGTKPDGSPWRIGVEKPDSAGRSIQMVVELTGDAVATSGDYRNFFKHDGIRYSHTIDPTTGRPVIHDLATVTVRADTCMKADAYATAILVMGPQRGYDWAEERGVAALLIRRTDAGPVEIKTPAWQAAIQSE